MSRFLGLCAFDLISDFDEWISSGYFTEKMRLRMQGMTGEVRVSFIHFVSS